MAAKWYEAYEHLDISLDGRVAIVRLNRPGVRNTTNYKMHDELERVWLDIARDEEIHAVVLTGAGEKFSAGGDVKAMAARFGTPDAVRHALRGPARGRRLVQNIIETPQPVIAAVNGDAVGLGATLALLCDITVMSETARIGDTHVKVGLVAGDGGSIIWPLLIGPNRAKDFLMRGRLINGAAAERLGIVNYAHPADEVLPKALEIAHELANGAGWAIRWTKLAVNKQIKDQINMILDASLAYEMLCVQSHDHGEAARAFAEKRKPQFQDD